MVSTIAIGEPLRPSSNIRVTNGIASPQGMAPYFVQLFMDDGDQGTSRCAGTIIDATTVITAGHCINDHGSTKTPDRIRIIYGNIARYDPSTPYPGAIVKATKATIHPNFDARRLHNDIAVLRVPPISFRPGFVEKVKIYSGPIEPLSIMRIFGWGKTQVGQPTHAKSLLTQHVFVAEPQVCQDIAPWYRGANGPQICTDNRYNLGVDVCQGDSGTGTTINANGKAYFAGIVSYGMDKYGRGTCGEAGGFGIYTRVSHYLGWIESVTGKHYGEG